MLADDGDEQASDSATPRSGRASARACREGSGRGAEEDYCSKAEVAGSIETLQQRLHSEGSNICTTEVAVDGRFESDTRSGRHAPAPGESGECADDEPTSAI